MKTYTVHISTSDGFKPKEMRACNVAGFQFYYLKSESGHYRITEPRSGAHLGSRKTLKGARETVVKRIADAGPAKFEDMILWYIGIHGTPPPPVANCGGAKVRCT